MLKKSCKNSQQIFCCFSCDYKTSRANDYDKHLLTPKHKKNEKRQKKVAAAQTKNSQRIFYCEKCEYRSSNNYNFEKHKLTAKHLKNEKLPQTRTTFFVCFCGKNYKFLTGLTRHKNVCKSNVNDNIIQDIKNNEEKPDSKTDTYGLLYSYLGRDPSHWERDILWDHTCDTWAYESESESEN